MPLAADFDGDGLTDLGFYKESAKAWFVKLSSSGYGTASLSGFGGPGHIAGAADYDGDRKADLTLFHNATRMWKFKLSGSGYGTIEFDSGYRP